MAPREPFPPLQSNVKGAIVPSGLLCPCLEGLHLASATLSAGVSRCHDNSGGGIYNRLAGAGGVTPGQGSVRRPFPPHPGAGQALA